MLAAICGLVLYMMTFSKSMYSVGFPKAYIFLFAIIPAILGVNLVLLDGFANMFYSHIVALNYILLFVVCIQAGVTTFTQSVSYYCYVACIYTFFFIFQYARAYSRGAINSSERISLVGYLVFFYMNSLLLLLNNYIYLRAEVTTFNNANLGAKNSAKIEGFVERLLPKHVDTCDAGQRPGRAGRLCSREG